MTVTNYTGWVADGKPWRDADPIHAYRFALLNLGALPEEIGTLGDLRHLTASVPQDHCPYSHTGWPKPNLYPNVCAIDYLGKWWASVAQYWIDEARTGRTPWVKYINDGEGHEYSHWDGFQKASPNADRNHVHMSIRTDWVHKGIGSFVVYPHRLNGGEDIVTSIPTLRLGSIGLPVKNLQAMLNVRSAGLTVDGNFGAHTQAAVETYQGQHDLTVDGVVGERTWGSLLIV